MYAGVVFVSSLLLVAVYQVGAQNDNTTTTYTEGESAVVVHSNAAADTTLRMSDSTTSTATCSIHTEEKDFYAYIRKIENESKVNLFKFKFRTLNYTKDPLYSIGSKNYQPWLWYRTRTRHGQTLLMLSFHYDVLSMSVLTIGVQDIDVNLTDTPRGCFGELTSDERMHKIRQLLLGSFKGGHEPRFGVDRRDYACNQIIKDQDGYGDFVYKCCRYDTSGKIKCSDEPNDSWIAILYFAVTLVKVLVFCFCPLFLPSNMYSAMYVAAEYVVKLKKEVKMKIFVTEQTHAHIKYKKRLTLEDISEWSRFREFIDNIPYDEMVPIKMSEIRITVKGKRIIPENEPPTGLLRTMYDNLCRCKIKALDPFNDCCDRSVYASMEPKFSHKLTWHKCVQGLVKCLMLLMVPIPYYIRLIIYYKFEHGEMTSRREALEAVHLEQRYNFYRTNVIQFYSPTHGVFIASYCFYFLAGLVIGFSDETIRDKLKQVTRHSLQDMCSVSQVGVLQIIMQIWLWPFKKCGLLAVLFAPVYAFVTAPFCLIVLVLYCIPTIYLSFRLLFHSRKEIGDSAMMEEEERRRKFRKIQKLGKRLSKMDKAVHNSGDSSSDDSCCPSSWAFQGCYTVRMLFLQVLCGGFCLCVLYALALIVAESFGLMVEVLAFTMMGIIVNASATLKYVSMVLLVFVYMHDCYDNVYQNYLTFNKTIIEDMIDRVEDLRKIASLPSSMQENAAFQVRSVEEVAEIKTQLNFSKKDISWRIGQLLMFLDSHDTPRIPLRLFKQLCEVTVHGAPGPVYLNLLRATGKFLTIVVFLVFVMIVVMAFGSVNQMSSTNQTLATLAGGFVPMLLKNILSSKSVKLSLKTISFKGQIDEILGEYKQNWPVKDLVAVHDLPEEEEEVDNKEGDDNDIEAKDRGNEKHDGGKAADKVEKKEKNVDKKNENSDASKEKSQNTNGEKRKESISPKIGLRTGASEAEPFKTPVDDDVVDLFIDLGVGDAAGGWSIYGSSTESVPTNSMMPAYFDSNRINYPAVNPV